MMKLGKKARGAVGYIVEFVTDIVMAADGVVEAKGADDRDVSAATGWHFGYYSRPKDGAQGVVLNFLGLSFLIAYRDSQYEMSLSKGEVGMQNAFGASILLNKNGVAEVNGTDFSALKTEDLLTDLKAFIPAVIADLASAAAAPVGTYAASLNTTALFAKAVTASGDPYKSTKVKNG